MSACQRDEPEATKDATQAIWVQASEAYSQRTLLRAAVQSIPHIGDALDTILSGLGARWRDERIRLFLADLANRLSCLEAQRILPSEEFFDFFSNTVDWVVRTRSEAKRGRLAAIVARQVQFRASWDDAEAAARLLGGLSDLAVEVLSAAARAPECGRPFEGFRAVALGEKRPGDARQPLSLLREFDSVPPHAIRLTTSELVAMGLLRDEGVGRLETKAMEYFVVTDLGEWFLGWLGEGSRSERDDERRTGNDEAGCEGGSIS